MSFHVYLEAELEQQLETVCRKAGLKRNTAVREALREYVAKRLEQSWPNAILKFQPDSTLPRFESERSDLLDDSDKPFPNTTPVKKQ
jgi:hypothetical protein